MKGLVFHGPQDIRYDAFPDPSLPSDNGVILKVNHCSICGSDLHIYHGDAISSTNYGADIARFCVGHEFSGEIVEAGRDVRGFRVGDMVFAAGGTGCGKCPSCLIGQPGLCRKVTAFGLSDQLNGGQAEFVGVPNADKTLHVIPDGVSEDQAILLTDALATAYFGVRNTSIEPGDAVTIVGLGPIGLLGIEVAFALGASQVFAIDPVDARRAQAGALGATAFAPGEDALANVRQATGGRGTQRVFEASGARSAVASVLGFVARGGTISFIGLPQQDVTLSLAGILYKNVTIRAGVAPVPDLWKNIIPLLQHGRVRGENLFSHRMRLSDGAEAYLMFDAREDGVLKIMMSVG